MKETNLVNRIFDEQIAGKVEFVEAESILWNFVKSDDGKITITTSDYWINEEDFIDTEFEGIINEYVKEEEE